jgi:DNA gyrase/topoisomerase IV subunit A
VTFLSQQEAHRILDLVFADPHRMIDAIAGADDPPAAVAALAAGFGITEEQARIVLDQQLEQLTRSKLANIQRVARGERPLR